MRGWLDICHRFRQDYKFRQERKFNSFTEWGVEWPVFVCRYCGIICDAANGVCDDKRCVAMSLYGVSSGTNQALPYYQATTELPLIPSYMNSVWHNRLPYPVTAALEHSGIVGYLGQQYGHSDVRQLREICERAVLDDALTERIEPDLFIRSLASGWIRMALREQQTQAVMQWADDYYKSLRKQKDRRERDVTTTGMRGFQESPATDEWDFAIGKLIGYRKWCAIMPKYTAPNIATGPEDLNPVLKGSYSGNFFDHAMLDDGRRVGVCKASAKHSRALVPADGCGCGWWAYWSPVEANKHGQVGHGDGEYDCVIAVEGSGRAVIGEKGFRSQYLKIIGMSPGSTRGSHASEAALEGIREFAGKYLEGVPVFPDEVTLKSAIGVDPEFGTLESRYPELKIHSDRALATYIKFMHTIATGISDRCGRLQEKLAANRSNIDIWDSVLAYEESRTDAARQYSFLQEALELVRSEYTIVDAILRERGAPWDDLISQMWQEHKNSLSYEPPETGRQRPGNLE